MLRPITASLLAGALAAGLLGLAAPAQARPEGRGDAGAPARAESRPTPSRLVRTPVLEARATLSADHLEAGPPSGAQVTPANGRTGPFAGQVIPGFSGVIDNGDGSYWAMPDNGFGAKNNSADFLLRLYKVKPKWETAEGGRGAIVVKKFISLRDPDHKISFPIVNGSTKRRLLTGADFDIESVVRLADGTFWIGEEFGPFLLHVSASGKLLTAPVPFPGGKSPQNPTLGTGETPNVAQSRGFEAMAASQDGRHLYPIVEGQLANDPVARRRIISEFDVRRQRYTGKTWAYAVDTDANVVGDAHMTGKHSLVVVERDDFEGAKAVTKRVYKVELNRTEGAGFVRKSLVVDLLKIANPDRIGTATSPGAYGIGSEFSFPFQSVETVVPLGGNRYLFANDNNFPGNAARYPGRPDDTEMIIVDLRKVRTDAPTAVLIGHRGASGYRPEHTLASYELAIRQCADYIEPDVVPTKDGKLVARHENDITATTNVSAHTEFADRKTTKTVDGTEITGWFTEDFTLAELRTLGAVERMPSVRPLNTAYDHRCGVLTLAEIVDLVERRSTRGRRVRVQAELKSPGWSTSIGLPMVDLLSAELRRLDATGSDGSVVVMAFEPDALRSLRSEFGHDGTRLVQLIEEEGVQDALITPSGLREISTYADGIAPHKGRILLHGADGTLVGVSDLITQAHRAGLTVEPWTLRPENVFLPSHLRVGSDPSGIGDAQTEARLLLALGVDGVITDAPETAHRARAELTAEALAPIKPRR